MGQRTSGLKGSSLTLDRMLTTASGDGKPKKNAARAVGAFFQARLFFGRKNAPGN
jgi:hypothetical protein